MKNCLITKTANTGEPSKHAVQECKTVQLTIFQHGSNITLLAYALQVKWRTIHKQALEKGPEGSWEQGGGVSRNVAAEKTFNRHNTPVVMF